MIRNRVYYRLKPFLPRRFRTFLRRWYTQRKQNKVEKFWPILPGSEKPPVGWSGWKDGKRFAVVLTHDVESSKGRDRCLQLMELQAKAGFRSSFNFIPEGDYSTPPELRETLTQNGFEVGVHDLKHDGMLYANRSKFRQAAQKINEYLESWKAVGFRSGFMHHNLEWAHDLHVLYDASTFDTDPFEPQPDGAGTIFPFWVPNAEGTGGYVELPYTLPQDSTLFVLLQKQSVEIWKQKIDWIAERGGMVLIDTHPDYMSFDGKPSYSEYPASKYGEILSYLKERYSGEYWHALPRELAEWYKLQEQGRRRAPEGNAADANLRNTLPENIAEKRRQIMMQPQETAFAVHRLNHLHARTTPSASSFNNYHLS